VKREFRRAEPPAVLWVISARTPAFLALAALGLSLAVWPSPASAEPYLAGYAGAAFTQKKDLDTRLEINNTAVVDGDAHDLKFETALLFGGKVGYFFGPSLLGGNVGLEAEAFHFEPDVRQQTSRFTGTLGGVSADRQIRVQHADVDITGAALNLVYRWRLAPEPELPRGRFQPYAGVGLAVLIAELSTTTTPFDVNKSISDTNVQPALQVLAGLRTFITPHIALFVEYKFLQSQRFTFDFTVPGTIGGFPVQETARDRADITSHHVSVGIGFHW
jgi:opacity protein-like surface antigen